MTYLNDLLEADNFTELVESSGKKLRDTYKLPEIAQLGFAFHEGFELELIEPVANAGFYVRDIDPKGRIFVHHFGFVTKDLEQCIERLLQADVPLLVRGKLNMGITRADFAYFDTRKDCGIISELISIRILGFHARLPRRLMALLARFQVKSGIRAFSV